MPKETTIDQMMKQLEERLSWFQSDEFALEEAKARFIEVRELAMAIEARLGDMQNEIEVLAKDFSE